MILLKVLILFSILQAQGKSVSKVEPVVSKKETRKQITLGAAHYPPFFSFTTGKKATGQAVNRIEKLLGSDFKLNWKRIPFARGEIALNNQVVDIFAGYAKAERAQTNSRELDYSDLPYMSLSLIVCALKDQIENFTVEDIKGKLLVHPSGSKTPQVLTGPGAKLVSIENDQHYTTRAIKLVESKRADFFYLPSIMLLKSHQPERFNCIPYGPPFQLYLTLKKGSPLTESVNQSMKRELRLQ